ncbi:MAG: hypothetical protein JWL77_5741 [Chthonomonadaceae bacterium]|nr:hypothetical protein [Chthonomonadaceae bacterium]
MRIARIAGIANIIDANGTRQSAWILDNKPVRKLRYTNPVSLYVIGTMRQCIHDRFQLCKHRQEGNLLKAPTLRLADNLEFIGKEGFCLLDQTGNRTLKPNVFDEI